MWNVRQRAQTDRREKVGGKASVLRVVLGEQAAHRDAVALIHEPVPQLPQTHVLRQLLERQHTHARTHTHTHTRTHTRTHTHALDNQAPTP
jgi:hypothetical protein